ncbi:MAG: deoxynucleoside kinase [Anaerolineales bacterium]|jgi:deoxyadenosine/deoxycytidine kinase|nr:deoxynucleoside kinase [Anaerolineales bacterium]
MKRFLVVAGNIGAGKSTLVRLLSEQLGWFPYYEPVAQNPYLVDFYANMRTWAFHSQVFFLTNRLRTHHQLMNHPSSVIQDRCVYEDAEVFAQNLFEQGLMTERDAQTYRDLYQVLVEFLPPPDLVVYLRASIPTLLGRISQRGRDYEQRIRPEYLVQLNHLYEKWISNFRLCPVLTVPADDLDYVRDPQHLDLIVHKVEEKLSGKEEVVFEEAEVNGLKPG